MIMAAAGIPSGLAGIVGAQNVIADPAHLAGYRIAQHIPKAAARPGTSQEVAEIVRLAAAEKLALVPVGARTKLGTDIPLRRYDLALDTTRLERVIAYDPDDLTLSVEPGIPLHRLAAVLAEHRQFLPLAVPFLRRATVGGTIASGVDSPLRQSYGTARDYLLGMEFVIGDGRSVKSGGRVVKNVSGYDLHKLMIGSLGSLGVITKVNFRTFPAPACIRAFVAAFDSAPRAVEMRQRLAQSPLRPLTMETLSPQAVELLSSGVAVRIEPGKLPADVLPRGRWVCLVSYAGTQKVLERYERELPAIASVGGAASLDESAASVVLGRVREFISIALESSPAAVIVKMSALPGRMGDLLDDVESVVTKLELRWAGVARGVGVIYCALLPSAFNEGARLNIARALEGLREACVRREGNFAVQWCPTDWKRPVAGRQATRSDLELMRKLKHVFDSSEVFAPDPLASWI